MTYTRVIPRDLFNEASLLKCYGRLWILLDETRGHNARLGDKNGEHYGVAFNIVQDEGDGSLTIHNIPFTIGGEDCKLSRPLNSRAPWPLWVEYRDESYEVFSEDGRLSDDFSKIIMGLMR